MAPLTQLHYPAFFCLTASLSVVGAAILSRAVFRWHPRGCESLASARVIGNWWRATWALLALGMVVLALSRVVQLLSGVPFSPTTSVVIGTGILFAGACFAETGFVINRGGSRWTLLFLFLIPWLFRLVV